MIMHATSSLEACRPLRNAERVQQYRNRTAPQTDHDRMVRDAQIASGIRWLESIRARPIPKHRALIVR